MAALLRPLDPNFPLRSELQILSAVLPDSGSRYLSTIYNDEWMIENEFTELSEADVYSTCIEYI